MTKKKKTGTGDGKSQLEEFKKAARELECDDDEDMFAERLKKLVKQTPKKN